MFKTNEKANETRVISITRGLASLSSPAPRRGFRAPARAAATPPPRARSSRLYAGCALCGAMGEALPVPSPLRGCGAFFNFDFTLCILAVARRFFLQHWEGLGETGNRSSYRQSSCNRRFFSGGERTWRWAKAHGVHSLRSGGVAGTASQSLRSSLSPPQPSTLNPQPSTPNS